MSQENSINQEALDAIEALQDKSLPIDTVQALYEKFSDNPKVVGQVAMNLSLRTSVYERSQEYSQTMVTLLNAIAHSSDMGARWAVAKNPHTPLETLLYLSKDSVNLVRALVATNPSTPASVLSTLFSDEKIVRDGLSGNPNTPQKYLEILADDNDKMVRLRLAENPSVTKSILQKLAQDIQQDVSRAAQLHLEKMT
ncbi:MAG: hypothetical protein KU37_05655 [Sulfuricurvum sp. PC08-66]|nr:MAG: hypothetical protein KU37_05655 [Sulfuricurvum sp. PC08-66]